MAAAFHFVTVRVRFRNGTYTCTFRGQRASCTISAHGAVKRLAEKLGYKPEAPIERVGQAADGGGEVWKIVDLGAGEARGRV